MTTASPVTLRRNPRGGLSALLPGSDEPVENVRVARCFPWSRPERYVSFRNPEGEELVLVEELDALDEATRALVHEELAAQEFLPRITAIESVDDQFDVMVWQVQTDRGPIALQVKEQEEVRQLDDGRVLVRDHAGGLFVVPDIDALDLCSRRLLEDRLA